MTERHLPGHVALIMDGNGRWARAQGFLRFRGHERGADALRRITRHAARLGIREITFFALSTENYRRRPRPEIDFLMRLLCDYLVGEREELAENNIRLKTIGRVHELPPAVVAEMEKTVEGSSRHTGMVLRLALNYGSRQEIVEAVRRAAQAVRDGLLSPEAIDEGTVARFLYDPEMPDPDLLIRTAGEVRLSNFFLWQASYTELWITDVLWPDFDVPHLEGALQAFQVRRRNFGAVEPPVPAASGAGPRHAR
jgi:undecaprenyl diphosphate synthase